MTEQMDCLRYRAHLDEWLDGELSEEMAQAMQAHADACPDCAEELRLAREALDLIHSLDDDIPVPLQAQAAWRKAVRAEAGKKRVPRRFSAAFRAIGTVAAAFVLLAGCTAAFRATGTLYPTARISGETAAVTSEADVPVTYARSGGAPMMERSMPMVYVASDGSAEDIPTVVSEDSAAKTRGAGPVQPQQTVAPLLIRRVERTILTDNFDGASQNVRDLTEQYGGYLADDAVTTADNGLRTGSFTAVIPAVEADSFLQTIDHVGSVTYTAEHFDDASTSIQDIQVRITALEAEHTRISELIAEATDAGELAQLSALLQANIAEMGTLENESNRLQVELDNVRISISLQELYPTVSLSPTAEPALPQLMGSAFSQSAQNFQSFVRDMAVTLMIIAPYLLAFAAGVLIILGAALLIRRVWRKHN